MLGLGAGEALSGLFSGGGSLVGGLIGGRQGKGLARRNFALQKEAFRWQQKSYRRQMMREDTAYQRKVKDMRKAGLSPILAAGGGPMTAAGPPSPQVPQMENLQAQNAALMSTLVRDAIGSMADVARSVVETKKAGTESRQAEVDLSVASATKDARIRQESHKANLLDQQVFNENRRGWILGHEASMKLWDEAVHKIKAQFMLRNPEFANREAAAKALAAQVLTHNLKVAERTGLPVGSSGQYQAIVQMILEAINRGVEVVR